MGSHLATRRDDMNPKPLHLGTMAHGYAIQFCDGRANSNRFAVTSEFHDVTCKRCAAKIAANPLPAVKA